LCSYFFFCSRQDICRKTEIMIKRNNIDRIIRGGKNRTEKLRRRGLFIYLFFHSHTLLEKLPSFLNLIIKRPSFFDQQQHRIDMAESFFFKMFAIMCCFRQILQFFFQEDILKRGEGTIVCSSSSKLSIFS